jgi:hypothetical protein
MIAFHGNLLCETPLSATDRFKFGQPRSQVWVLPIVAKWSATTFADHLGCQNPLLFSG